MDSPDDQYNNYIKEKSDFAEFIKDACKTTLRMCMNAWSPHYAKEKELLEKIQWRFRRMFKEWKLCERLKKVLRSRSGRVLECFGPTHTGCTRS